MAGEVLVTCAKSTFWTFATVCVRIYVFPLVGFQGNLSLLDSFNTLSGGDVSNHKWVSEMNHQKANSGVVVFVSM